MCCFEKKIELIDESLKDRSQYYSLLIILVPNLGFTFVVRLSGFIYNLGYTPGPTACPHCNRTFKLWYQ